MTLSEQFKARGARMTVARRVLTGELEQATEPVGAEELCVRCAKKNRRVHRATVYRTLGLLAAHGLVSVVKASENGAAKYFPLRGEG